MKIRPFYLLVFFLLLLTGIEFFYTILPITLERTSKIMGTTVRVEISGPGSPHLTRRALFEIQRLDKIFNKFNKYSEISLINSLAGKAPLQVSSDTFNVIKQAIEVNELSRGAFDVTLGHPDDLLLDENLGKIYLKRKGTRINLGGIGKGYAVESARRLLLKKGVKSAIIDMHSSIAVIGGPWRVGILDPRNQKILGTVVLNDGDALSTSAQYEQPRHIVDPRTGRQADKCLSVTLVARDAGLADALSTAVFVMGPAEGMKLANKLGVKVVIVDKNGMIYDNTGVKLR